MCECIRTCIGNPYLACPRHLGKASLARRQKGSPGCAAPGDHYIAGSFPCGEVAEWLKAHAWKACIRETVSRVRIPLSPPVSLCETRVLSSLQGLCRTSRGLARSVAHFSVSESKKWPLAGALRRPVLSQAGASVRLWSSRPVIPIGEFSGSSAGLAGGQARSE
jgi:hypothetical protein